MPSLTASSSLTALSATPAPSGTGRGASGTQPARFTNGPCHGGAPPAPGERGHRTPSPDALTGRDGAGTDSLICSNRVMDVVWPRWWHYPDTCGNGHQWGPCPASVSQVPCDCGPALAGRERLQEHHRGRLPGAGLPVGVVSAQARADAIPGLLNKRRNPGSGAYQSRPGGFGAGSHGGPPDTFGGRGGLVPEAGGSMSAGDLWLLPALPAPGRLDREAVTMSEDLAS